MKKEFLLSLIIIASLFLAGCTSDTTEEEEGSGAPAGKTDQEVFVGSWEYVTVMAEVGEVPLDMVLNADGTGTESGMNITWSIDSTAKTFEWTGESEGGPYDYTIKSNDRIDLDYTGVEEKMFLRRK